jgi:ribonuclease HI
MAQLPVLTIHTDGASRGNPGAAACAYVIARDGDLNIEAAECLGEMTNNQAEYTALVRALEHALELGPGHSVKVYSDSELMVKQMRGEYRVKDDGLRDLYQKARTLAGRFQGEVRFQHVRRTQNSRADALCNEALDGKCLARPRAAPQPDAGGPGLAKPGLREQALACLREAARAWGNGTARPTPEEVWGKLVEVLAQHRVKLP